MLHSIIVAKVIDTLALKPILLMTIAFQVVQVLGDCRLSRYIRQRVRNLRIEFVRGTDGSKLYLRIIFKEVILGLPWLSSG